jgi:flagellar motor switch protein FliN/FliY
MNSLQQEILEQLGVQFSLALEGMLGEKWPSELKDVPIPQAPGDVLCWTQRFNFVKDPALHVAIHHASWRDIGSRALIAVGIEEPAEADIRATYLELLTQALSGLARFLTAKAGSEVALDSGEEVALQTGSGAIPFQGIRFKSPAGLTMDLFVRLEAVLLQSLLPKKSQEASEPSPRPGNEPPGRAAAAAAGASDGAPKGGASIQPTMDLLLDVQMPVSVSFGRTQLQLKDIVKLSTGSIIELNRTVNEPVDVVVNNCIIARGEVVVIEGNYGVRIHQIVSRAERLRTFD